VVVVGLGPAGPELTTPQAHAALASAPVVLVRTSRHPAAAPLLAAGARPLDGCYEQARTFAQAYECIVEAVVEAAERHGAAAYAVPGSPYVLEAAAARLAADERVAVETVPGMSFLELVADRLALDPFAERLRLVDGEEFSAAAAGEGGPFLVAQVWSRQHLSEVKLALEAPPASAVLLHHLGLDDEVVLELEWAELDRRLEPDHLTCLYVPAPAEPAAVELVRAAEVVRTLRGACPWDRAQTHRSLVRHLLEEAYEAVEAIEALADPPTPAQVEHLEEELGDVLCQVLFHATLAAEAGLFTLSDVARRLHDKLVDRHPHVFGGEELDSAEAVLGRWEQRKQAEKGRSSLLEGIPAALPALALAAALERRARSVGLGWPAGAGPAELSALARALERGDGSRAGELLLGLARLAVDAGVDPEAALRQAATAFRARFAAADRGAREAGTTLEAAAPAERLRLLEEAAP